MYLIMHKPSGQFLGFSVGEYEVATFQLNDSTLDTNIWVTTKKEIAQRAIKEHPNWFNADMETPINPFDSDDLEVWVVAKARALENETK